MVIHLDSELAAALNEQAKRQGIAPDELALRTLRQHFITAAALEPRDDWERRLLEIGRDCGVSLSNWAVSSDGLYD